jgi:hypothetical protein
MYNVWIVQQFSADLPRTVWSAEYEQMNDFAVVYTGGVDTKNGRPIRWYRPDLRGDIYPEVLCEFAMNPHSGHMIRASKYAAVGGFDAEFPRGVDWELSIRLARKYKYDYIQEPLVERKIHDENISENADRGDVGKLVWEKHGAKIRQHPEIERVFRTNWRQRKAWRALERGHRGETVRHLLSVFKRNPTISHGFILRQRGNPAVYGCLLPTNAIAVADELRPEDGASFEGVATETG